MKFRFVLLLTLLLAACSQNIEVVSSGERLEDAPKPAADDKAAAPLAHAGSSIGTNFVHIVVARP